MMAIVTMSSSNVKPRISPFMSFPPADQIRSGRVQVAALRRTFDQTYRHAACARALSRLEDEAAQAFVPGAGGRNVTARSLDGNWREPRIETSGWVRIRCTRPRSSGRAQL